ncbi:MAG: S41 family peptidase, partial [Acidobacteriota bacterium]
TGEEEIWVIAQDGSTPAVPLTTGGKAQRYGTLWSPDSKKIAFSDKDGKVYVDTVATKQMQMIVDAPNGQIGDYTWSPKGYYIAYSMQSKNGLNAVYIWNSADNKNMRVTPELFNANTPAFDPVGNFLYFLSDHEFAPLISSAEYNYATNRTTQVYSLTLQTAGKNPFPYENDEVTITEDKTAGPAATPTPKPDTTETINFEGIEKRVVKVPLPADNYNNLSANKGNLIYTINGAFYNGRQSDTPPSLRIYSIKDRKETTLVTPAGNYALSSDGTKLMTAGQGGFAVYDANPNGERSRKGVLTAGMVTEVDPVKEWNQIFNEVWRRYRDWFYVENMHGFNWEQLREEYKKWLPYVSHRSDLNYVLAEMQSELTVQHAYIDGGDFNLPPRVRVALPGARFELDKASGRYKISKIFGGQNEEDIYRSPLTEVGSTANVGDYVLAINGEDVTGSRDIYSYLRGKGDTTVTFTVNSTPSMTGSHTVTFRPVTNESDLVYMDWVDSNRRRVDQMSGGRLGYLHIPDMGPAGIREFIKWYYPQLNKEGLVVDVRANGGGNVSRMIIERLGRKVLGMNFTRGNQDATTYPDGAFLGPMIGILDANSASDGDIFPYMFRQAGLGQLVGTRSWGGVVGITNHGNLIDGGVVNVPEFALLNLKGEYIIEGYGVDPDIEVENDPKSVIAGRDPQLERSVTELMKKITTPVKLPGRPADPVKVPKN